MSELKLELEYNRLIGKIRRDFKESGHMRGLSLVVLSNNIDKEFALHREVLQESLTRDWDFLFPSIPFTEKGLNSYLDKFLTERRKEVLRTLEIKLRAEEKWKKFRNWFFRKEQFHFLACVTSSFITYPAFFILFFSPSDWKLQFGLFGFLANSALLAFLYWRNRKSYNAMMETI